MTQLQFPIVWLVLLTIQLVWWSHISQPGRLDRLSPRKVAALRDTAALPDPWVIALVVGLILVPVGVALLVEEALVGAAYLAVGAALLAAAGVTRRTGSRVIRTLGDRGALDAAFDAGKGERRRRRAGLAALIAMALAILPFHAYEQADHDVVLAVGLVLSSIGMLVFCIAVVPYGIGTLRRYEARRLAPLPLEPPEAPPPAST